MRVAARDAPSRVDEARPEIPPNEDDLMLMGGSAEQRCLAFAAVRRRRARAGRGGAPRDGTVRCDGAPRGTRWPAATTRPGIANGPDRARTMNGGGVTRGFPLEIRRFAEFYQAFRGRYLISNAFIDLSVRGKCRRLSIFYLCSFRNGLLHDKFGLALT
ncbi:hypothetical protein [Burkholderia latens]|uniref:hypothetical protein n=1 Tax=Burkholderia latens TaxID=488446 RepID=UPI001ABBA24B|nr:hypothetical protein [Burkholderia latens]